MAVDLDDTALLRWRASPIAFIEEMLHDPETGKPFVLLEAERAFMRHAFTLDAQRPFAYPELVYGATKKSGKTTLAALIVLVMVLLRSDGRFAEGYCVANDLEQAQSRVFTVIRRIVEASPLLRHEAKITADRITFPALDASIMAIASDAASAAGGNPTISCFDELWGYTTERSRRLWDEMITSPARKISCRLTTTYAGFTGESVLLEELYKRGMALPRGWSELACWRRHAVRVAPRADRTVAGRAVAGGDAAQPAAERLCAHDHERVRVDREHVCRSGRVGRLRAARAGAGAAGQDP